MLSMWRYSFSKEHGSIQIFVQFEKQNATHINPISRDPGGKR